MKFIISLMLYFLLINYSDAAPFQNGSFEHDSSLWTDGGTGIDALSTTEQDLTGWTIEHIAGGDNLDWLLMNSYGIALAGGGNYKIEFAGTNSQMRTYQIFDTVAGKQYQIVFYLYGRSGATAPNSEILTTIKNQNGAGTTLFSRTDLPLRNDSWQKYTATFTASSNSTYLAFENKTVSSNGASLDLITINMLPSLTSNDKTYVYDPGHQELKAVPGNDMVFMYSLENSGGSPDTGTVSMRFNIPTTLSFKLDSLTFVDGETVGTTGYDPLFDGNATSSSGLTCCTGLEISYSNGGGFNYVPSPVYYNDFGEGYDPTVRAIRIIPSGIMNDGSVSPTGFRAYYQAQIN